MNDREKRLLLALGAALFAVVTLYGFRSLTAKQDAVKAEIRGLETRLNTLVMLDRTQESMAEDVEWLTKNQPAPKEGELAPSQLESLVTSTATAAGLSVDKPKILDNIEGVGFYDRARFQISVSGEEIKLYQWLVQMHSPKDFRAVTAIRLYPNREDDTKIDAVAIVEEWFTPLAGPDPELESPADGA
jgi:type II secretory pathway component PulM